jgi:hypothetical protein
MSQHEEYVRRILSVVHDSGYLKSRESNTIEFKESFNKGNTAKYAKTMAAFANNRGGYIVFGVKDTPREVVGLKNNNFENLNQEDFTDAINSLFAPSLEWECGTFVLQTQMITRKANGEDEIIVMDKQIGWIYTEEAEYKPVIAQKGDNGEKILSGDVYYRYRARSERIKYAEMNHIVEVRAAREREGLLKFLEVARKSGTANLGIINYSNGKASTPYGVDVALDHKLVTQVLKKAKFIKEGSFNETNGIPVIKVTGNIDLAEEVPVLDLEPDKGYPYIQKDLSEKLGISSQDLYALVFYYAMKKSKRFSIGVTTSRTGKQNFKFSEYALEFLQAKFNELKDNESEFNKIRVAYKNRNNSEGTTHV